jgi:hypothetical protein
MPWPSLPFPAAPSLRIEFSEGDNNVFFLYPSLEFEDKVPIADTTVEGKVILSLPAPRKVSVVTVELVRRSGDVNRTLGTSFDAWGSSLFCWRSC